MGTAKQAETTPHEQPIKNSDAYPAPQWIKDAVIERLRSIGQSPDQPGEHDPLLRRLHRPSDLKEKGWEGVARTYFSVAQTYAAKNDRHIRELATARDEHHQWKIEQLERSGKEYARLLEKIKSLDGEIDQLKATIHLLTKARS